MLKRSQLLTIELSTVKRFHLYVTVLLFSLFFILFGNFYINKTILTNKALKSAAQINTIGFEGGVVKDIYFNKNDLRFFGKLQGFISDNSKDNTKWVYIFKNTGLHRNSGQALLQCVTYISSGYPFPQAYWLGKKDLKLSNFKQAKVWTEDTLILTNELLRYYNSNSKKIDRAIRYYANKEGQPDAFITFKSFIRNLHKAEIVAINTKGILNRITRFEQEELAYSKLTNFGVYYFLFLFIAFIFGVLDIFGLEKRWILGIFWIPFVMYLFIFSGLFYIYYFNI
jgi:hypothetical protein